MSLKKFIKLLDIWTSLKSGQQNNGLSDEVFLEDIIEGVL
jgi:hypothetical protein